MVTIYDVAKYVGVSPTTVSSVLNDDPRVKESTRQRVKDAIRELGYVVNQNARGLAKRETKTLGIIMGVDTARAHPYEVNNERGQFLYTVSDGILDRLGETGYSIITERSFLPQVNDDVPQCVKDARVDGVFLIGSQFSESLVDRIRGYDIPVVGVILLSCEQIDVVSSDYAKGTYLATLELLENGCRNVVLLNAPERFATSFPRTEGWKRALEQYENTSVQHMEIRVPAVTGGGGYQAMKEIWEQGLRPDGITTANEMIALGARRYLTEQGIRVPEEVSITVTESSNLGAYAVPPLTAVEIHKEQIGAQAADLMLRRLKNPHAPVKRVLVEPTLVRRASVRSKTE